MIKHEKEDELVENEIIDKKTEKEEIQKQIDEMKELFEDTRNVI